MFEFKIAATKGILESSSSDNLIPLDQIERTLFDIIGDKFANLFNIRKVFQINLMILH